MNKPLKKSKQEIEDIDDEELDQEKIPIENDEDDDSYDIIENQPVKEIKSTTFLESIPKNENIKISIYKKDKNTRKMFFLESMFLDEKVIDYDELRKKWGGGSFVFYANKITDDGKYKQINSCRINLADPPNEEIRENKNPYEYIAGLEDQALERVAKLRALFGDNSNNNNSMLMEIMKTQQSMFQELAKSQRESEHRMYETIEKITNKNQNSMTEILNAVQIIDDIRGGGVGETGFLEKILPHLAPAIPGIIQGLTSNPQVQNTAVPIPKKQPQDNASIIKKIVNQVPENIKNILTRENANDIIKAINEKNPNLSIALLNNVANEILKEKGL